VRPWSYAPNLIDQGQSVCHAAEVHQSRADVVDPGIHMHLTMVGIANEE
jgi:hypothetical protein